MKQSKEKEEEEGGTGVEKVAEGGEVNGADLRYLPLLFPSSRVQRQTIIIASIITAIS